MSPPCAATGLGVQPPTRCRGRCRPTQAPFFDGTSRPTTTTVPDNTAAAPLATRTRSAGCIVTGRAAPPPVLSGAHPRRSCGGGARSRGPRRRGGVCLRCTRVGTAGGAATPKNARNIVDALVASASGVPTWPARCSALLVPGDPVRGAGRPATPAAGGRATVSRCGFRGRLNGGGTAPPARAALCAPWCPASATPCTGAGAPNVVRGLGIGGRTLLLRPWPLPLLLGPLDVPRHDGHAKEPRPLPEEGPTE